MEQNSCEGKANLSHFINMACDCNFSGHVVEWSRLVCVVVVEEPPPNARGAPLPLHSLGRQAIPCGLVGNLKFVCRIQEWLTSRVSEELVELKQGLQHVILQLFLRHWILGQLLQFKVQSLDVQGQVKCCFVGSWKFAC